METIKINLLLHKGQLKLRFLKKQFIIHNIYHVEKHMSTPHYSKTFYSKHNSITHSLNKPRQAPDFSFVSQRNTKVWKVY
jgi:hypothetical protein